MKANIVHVGRECSGVVGGGGAGDVILQLADQCAREGYPTSIIIPFYGNIKRDTEKFGSDEAIEMDYAGIRRVETVAFHRVRDLNGQKGLDLWLIKADRFGGKHHPYLYTRDEADLFAKLRADEALFCGAEPPPKDYAGPQGLAGVGHYDFFAMNVLLQKAVLRLVASHTLDECVLHCHDAHVASLPMLLKATKK